MANFSFKSYEKPTFELEMTDGSIVKIYTPTKELFGVISNATNQLQSDNSVEAVAVLYDCVLKILNNNTENKKFKKADVDALGFDSIVPFITAYVEFVNTSISAKN